MELYRVTRLKYSGSNPFDGEGSYRFGGRWSSAGVRLAYTATSRALAILEYRAHLDSLSIPDDLVIATLRLPNTIEIAHAPKLPSRWRDEPAPPELQETGNHFIRLAQHAFMLIPSVLVPRENNVLVNPMHTDFLACSVEAELEPFAFDARLLCPPR